MISTNMEKSKKQVLPSGLWVVATPIGNLKDLSERARQALEEAHGILCEDSRETLKLLTAIGLDRSFSELERFDAHSTPRTVEKIIERIKGGENLALVTDAGTPAVSDPGSKLVARAWEEGVRVTPIPGPSALMSFLSVCGFSETSFVFKGFFPRKLGERKEELEQALLSAASSLAKIFVWFESPHRIVDSLEVLAEVLEQRAPESRVVAAKELTKIHEQIFVGSALEVFERVKREISNEGAKGEWCFAVEFSVEKEEGSDWVKTLQCLMDCQVSASDAAKRVSQYFGVSKKTVYEKILHISGKKMKQGIE